MGDEEPIFCAKNEEVAWHLVDKSFRSLSDAREAGVAALNAKAPELEVLYNDIVKWHIDPGSREFFTADRLKSLFELTQAVMEIKALALTEVESQLETSQTALTKLRKVKKELEQENARLEEENFEMNKQISEQNELVASSDGDAGSTQAAAALRRLQVEHTALKRQLDQRNDAAELQKRKEQELVDELNSERQKCDELQIKLQHALSEKKALQDGFEREMEELQERERNSRQRTQQVARNSLQISKYLSDIRALEKAASLAQAERDSQAEVKTREGG